MNATKLGIRVVSAALMIFIIVKIREYLSEMSQCGCTSQSFERIRFLEMIIIGIIIVGLIFDPNIQSGFSSTKTNIFKQADSWFNKIILPISMIVYLYLIYNTIQFSKDANKDDSCKKCGDKWEKYALYAQNALYAFSAAVLIIGGAMFVNAGVTSVTSGFGLAAVAGILFILGLVATTIFGGSVNDVLDKAIELSNEKKKDGFSECGCANKETKKEGFCGCANKDTEKNFRQLI